MIASIDRYQISRELGRGGMAVVYLGYDPRIGREVAIKVMSTALQDDEIYRKRFNQEVRAIAALEHPHIVPVYDYGLYDKRPFLVMRHMAGGSLAERLVSGPLPLAETVVIMRRIGEALDEAHSRGIIHRDLKPANILLDQYGKAFLSDFGIVKTVDAKATPTDPESLTGTPSYMSPEQIQGNRELDGRSDIYSVGAMLFELLSGHRPYAAEGGVAVALKHLTEPVPNILALNPDLPKEVDCIILRAMSKSPEERYPTVGKLVADLAAAAGETPSALDIDTPVSSRTAGLGTAVDSPATMPVDDSQPSASRGLAQGARRPVRNPDTVLNRHLLRSHARSRRHPEYPAPSGRYCGPARAARSANKVPPMAGHAAAGARGAECTLPLRPL